MPSSKFSCAFCPSMYSGFIDFLPMPTKPLRDSCLLLMQLWLRLRSQEGMAW